MHGDVYLADLNPSRGLEQAGIIKLYLFYILLYAFISTYN
jgi:hypothetical protein